jgi:uncharacterized protein (DUF58 family)
MSQFMWLLLLLLAIAFLLRVDFIYYILYVVVGVFLWSRWHTPRAMKGLVASRVYSQRAFLSEVVRVTLILENKSRLSIPWIQFHESIPPELRLEGNIQKVISVKGRDKVEYHYHVKGLQRGYYRLGPLRLISGDLFGLSKAQRGYLPPDYLTVYPRIIPLSRLGLPSRLPFGTIASYQRLFEDPARPMGVRDFRSGDTLRQINWKASAHTQNLLVRTFQPAISLDTSILLDLNSSAYVRRELHYTSEWAIVVAASLAAHLINNRQAVGLITNGVDPLRLKEESREFDDATGRLKSKSESTEQSFLRYMPPAIPPHSGRPHLMKILEQLARVETQETLSFQEWAPIASLGLSWGVTILAITNRGDDKTCNTMHRLVRKGYNPILITVEPDANFAQVRERARRSGFQAFNISSPRKLDIWRVSQTPANFPTMTL